MKTTYKKLKPTIITIAVTNDSVLIVLGSFISRCNRILDERAPQKKNNI